MLAKIYVPSENDKILRALAKRFSEIFGGCTIIPNCKGFWINDQKQLIEDKITIIEAYFNEQSLTKSQAQIYLVNIAYDIKRALKQDCVAYCIDNDIYFY